jgi:hypothetical protein
MLDGGTEETLRHSQIEQDVAAQALLLVEFGKMVGELFEGLVAGKITREVAHTAGEMRPSAFVQNLARLAAFAALVDRR